MNVDIQVGRDVDPLRLIPTGAFDLVHSVEATRAAENVERQLDGCSSVELDLSQLDTMDGTGAVLLARLLDRLEAGGCRTRVPEDRNPRAARLVRLYRERRTPWPRPKTRPGAFGRMGSVAAQLPGKVRDALDFTGSFAAALPKAVVAPRSVNWGSLPALTQAIGADALPVTSAANLLVGLIIGFLGVSQLGRFGAVTFVPELVVVAHFRELGPLVTAIIVAGRSGAGLASELATMKVSEEIDALRSMGFDPMRWLVVPRCLAVAAVVPILTWVGDLVALAGGMLATIGLTDMTPRAYIMATADAITVGHLLGGLIKTPFLGLALALIACSQGLATRGGAAAVGSRTTTAVVLATFSVIVINSLFTLFYVLMGI